MLVQNKGKRVTLDRLRLVDRLTVYHLKCNPYIE